MKTYELTYIITPEIASEEAEAKAREIESLIQAKEGVILAQSNPSAKALSYPIKGRASGFFGAIEFQMEPENLAQIKETLSKDGNIVRHMVIIKEAQRARKIRASKAKPAENLEDLSMKSKEKEKEKVELKDIEQKLDEILGE